MTSSLPSYKPSTSFRSRLSVFKLSIKELERLGSVTSRGRGKRSLLVQRLIIIKSVVCKVGVDSIALGGVFGFVAYN